MYCTKKSLKKRAPRPSHDGQWRPTYIRRPQSDVWVAQLRYRECWERGSFFFARPFLKGIGKKKIACEFYLCNVDNVTVWHDMTVPLSFTFRKQGEWFCHVQIYPASSAETKKKCLTSTFFFQKAHYLSLWMKLQGTEGGQSRNTCHGGGIWLGHLTSMFFLTRNHRQRLNFAKMHKPRLRKHESAKKKKMNGCLGPIFTKSVRKRGRAVWPRNLCGIIAWL